MWNFCRKTHHWEFFKTCSNNLNLVFLLVLVAWSSWSIKFQKNLVKVIKWIKKVGWHTLWFPDNFAPWNALLQSGLVHFASKLTLLLNTLYSLTHFTPQHTWVCKVCQRARCSREPSVCQPKITYSKQIFHFYLIVNKWSNFPSTQIQTLKFLIGTKTHCEITKLPTKAI